MHDIEHQITYHGSNFIFHDSRGFESGSTEELEIAWEFIEKKSAETELKKPAACNLVSCFIPSQYWPTWLPVGTVYPWTALVPFYLQNFNSSIKGQAEVSHNEFISHLVVFGGFIAVTFFSLPNCHKIYQVPIYI